MRCDGRGEREHTEKYYGVLPQTPPSAALTFFALYGHNFLLCFSFFI